MSRPGEDTPPDGVLAAADRGTSTTSQPPISVPANNGMPGFAAAIPPQSESPKDLTPQQDEKVNVLQENPSTSQSASSNSSTTESTTDEKAKTRPKSGDGNEKGQNPFAHLPEHEQQILRRQLEVPEIKTQIKLLFRYATRNDCLIMSAAAFCAVAAGAVMPLMTVVFGNQAKSFQSFELGEVSASSFNHTLTTFTLYFLYLGIAEFFTTYIATVGFIYTGEHITSKIREQYLAAILRQNIGFFDKLGAGEITTRITADTNLVQDGMSQKVALTITALAAFITAYVIGFIKYWKLTLIMSSILFAIVITMGTGSRFLVKWNKKALTSYALGGTVAEEVLSSIRNTTAFSTQDKLARQYDSYLVTAETWGKRHRALLGVFLGVMMALVYLNYALAFWQGSIFLVNGEGGVNISTILTILLAVMIGAFQLGNVAPNLQAFTTGLAAAGKIFATIDRVSPLDATTDVGVKLDHVEGNLELKNIRHIYPSRPNVVVMDGVNLFVPAGKTTALVGASGCGKSTIIGLVERFYDPVGGQVLLDGHDIQTMNLQFLRRHMSLVSQEPTLFGTTIYNNIAHGLIGTKFEDLAEEKKTDMIIEAAKMANAHDFIENLPEGYQTNVGDRGFLLSGGQKQRVAIARAVVSDPTILLLDEATSALDTKSEGIVQVALDKAAKGRTTIIIAHRLSTIREADNIVVMSEGRIVEEGTHEQLLEMRSAYFGLVRAQRITAVDKEQATEEAESSEDADVTKVLTAKSDSYESEKMIYRTATNKSISSAKLKEKTQGAEAKPQYSLWTLLKLIASFNKPEWPAMLAGLFFSIISGGAHPTQAVFFGKSIFALTRPPSQYGILRSEIDFWSAMFVMLSGVMFLAHSGHGICFAFCSERLIRRVRDRAFRTMLRQDIGFFDREENSSGALTSFLSTQATQVAGLSGATLGTLLSVTTTLVAAFALSIAIGYKLALVCISTVPVLLGCGFLRFWMLQRLERRAKAAYESSANYACEATSAIRTVASLTREHDVWLNYHNQLVEQQRRSLSSVLKSSSLYAGSQSLTFLCIGLGFWYGGTLIAKGEYGIESFFITFSAVIFGAQSAGTIFSFAPDMGKAKNAAAELKALFDRKPEIDTWSTDGDHVESVEGALEFIDVHFRYPTRPTQPVLRGLNLSVKPGEYIALVGPSGCGKSTTIGLLERFYSPLSGSITLDGVDISSLNLLEYRSHIALVSQEPTLYQGNIRDNILLGADHAADAVSEEKLEQVCRDANIYNFIISLPNGFDTNIGGKGLLLSGGQKQRIAIARALLRDPKVLLLDEATSALDSESEAVVQDALDRASKGRTTVAVAHRLSTIQKASRIFVFEGGRVVEEGTHEALMRRGGRYRELVSLQDLERHG